MIWYLIVCWIRTNKKKTTVIQKQQKRWSNDLFFVFDWRKKEAKGREKKKERKDKRTNTNNKVGKVWNLKNDWMGRSH